MIGVLHTARINAIEFIVSSDKLIKMVNFKLGNEMWRWINQHDTSVGQRKILTNLNFFINIWGCHFWVILTLKRPLSGLNHQSPVTSTVFLKPANVYPENQYTTTCRQWYIKALKANKHQQWMINQTAWKENMWNSNVALNISATCMHTYKKFTHFMESVKTLLDRWPPPC